MFRLCSYDTLLVASFITFIDILDKFGERKVARKLRALRALSIDKIPQQGAQNPPCKILAFIAHFWKVSPTPSLQGTFHRFSRYFR